MSNGRTVATDALATLGTIIGKNEKRDAIHIAVLPMVAGTRMFPGTPCGVGAGGVASDEVPDEKRHGIVDPFLEEPVEKGQMFWMLLKPRMVTSLRHVWEHPAFPASELVENKKADPFACCGGNDETPTDHCTDCPVREDVIAQSVEDALAGSLKEFTTATGLSLDELVDGATNYLANGDLLSEGARWDGQGVPEEFWKYYEARTGTVVLDEKRYTFFTWKTPSLSVWRRSYLAQGGRTK